jgi:hypothetical protein
MQFATTSQRMPKVLTIAGMVVAALLLLMFGLDMAVGIPFGHAAGMTVDGLFLVCAGLLGFMSWTTYREQA